MARASRTAREEKITKGTRAGGVLGIVRGLGSRGKDAGIERLIHERVRLAIVSALAVNESLTFAELRDILQTSDGNLSVHARKLEEASYVRCSKTFEGRIPRTEYRLTAAGRRALDRYLSHMQHLVTAVNRESPPRSQ